MPNLFSGPFYLQLAQSAKVLGLLSDQIMKIRAKNTVAPVQWTTTYPLSHLPLGFLLLYAIQQPSYKRKN